jgi:hypothetical protein
MSVGEETLESQCDQIGRIFVYWAIVFKGQLFDNYRSSPKLFHCKKLCISFDKNRVGLHLRRFFRKLIWSWRTVSTLFPVPPIRAKIVREWSFFSAGQAYNVSCQVLGSRPPAVTSIFVGPSQLREVNYQVSFLRGLWPGVYPTKSYKYWSTNICSCKYV